MIPYHYPVHSPPKPCAESVFMGESQIVPIQFRIGYEGAFDPNTPCWYACWSCYAASRETEYVFRTSPASASNMKLGATEQQRAQMKQHAEQHSIIWSWARQQDR